MDWLEILMMLTGVGFAFLMPGCACCGDECSSRAETYEITVSGITDGSFCSVCDSWNGTWTLDYFGYNGSVCIWRTSEQASGDCASFAHRWELQMDPVSGTASMTPWPDGSSYNGTATGAASFDLTLTAGTLEKCATRPATITVTPV